jgi:cell division protein FtsB
MDDTDNSRVINPLRQHIAMFEIENGKIKAENVELKARIAKLEDKQIQNELILSVLQKLLDP